MNRGNATIAAVTITAAAFLTVNTPPAHADTETYDSLFHWVDWMAKKYHMGNVYVGQQYMEPGVYGTSIGRTITFNSLYVDNPDELYWSLVDDVASGFHPGAACTATQALAVHESAHVLDSLTNFTARDELAYAVSNGLSGKISGYSFNEDGTVNSGEALADAMVAVECDTPTPAQLALWKMLVS